jgi:hypothetical protein
MLALDGSECSAAATRAVLAQFHPKNADVRVVHAINWEHLVPISLQFDRGSEGPHAYQTLRDWPACTADALVARAAGQLRDAGFRPVSQFMRENRAGSCWTVPPRGAPT